MLNRIYIVVGLIAIAVLAGAFLAPRFIEWSDYRDRMEVLAASVLGAEVTIEGDIDFALLPQPRLVFSDVVVGPANKPAATIAGVEAEFALMDFLRDQYNLTQLVLRAPVINLVIDENGLLSSGVEIAGTGSGVVLDQARVEEGRIGLTDLRSGESHSFSAISGDLRLSSLAGPYQFSGRLQYQNDPFEIRLSSGVADAEGTARLTAFLGRTGGAYSLTLDGAMTSGIAPKFDGAMTYRQAPPPAATAEDIRGNLVLESKVTASTDRVVLNGYTLLLDENRAGMRLTGAASIQLGTRRDFEAVVSGGVFNLPPRDANEVASEQPYELVRLLSELPAPPLPPIPGRLGVDLAEIGLRGASLRNVRVDANFDGSAWQVSRALAELPGNTSVSLAGTLRGIDDKPSFNGNLTLASARLDAFSHLWRRAREDNPLANTAGRLEGQVIFAGEAFGFSHGRLTLNNRVHAVELRLGFGDEPRIDLVGRFDDLTAADSAALGALFPDPASDNTFAVSFPQGSFAVHTKATRVLGLDATDLIAEGSWTEEELRLTRFVSSDLGGLGLDLIGTATGTLAAPELGLSGRVQLDNRSAPALTALYDLAGLPEGWRRALAGSIPLDLELDLTRPSSVGGQILSLNGTAGAGMLTLRADLEKGLAGLDEGHILLSASIEGDDAAGIMAQLGLAEVSPFAADAPAMVSLFAEGTRGDGFDTRIAASQNDESIAYVGTLTLADSGEVSGAGTIDVQLENGSGLAGLAGIPGLGLGSFEASAGVRFAGTSRVTLSGISGVTGAGGFGGNLELAAVGQLPSFSGTLSFDHLAAEHLAGSILSPAALIGTDGVWPEGPLAGANALRPSRGTIAVEADQLGIGNVSLANARFDVTWNPQSIGLSRFTGAIGNGSATLDLTLCCAGPLPDRVLSGRLTLTDVDLAAILPETISSGVSGSLTSGLQFEGTGASLAEVMAAMTGEGNFSLADLELTRLDPQVYPAISGLENVLQTEAEVLEILIAQALERSSFVAESAQGAFTIAGGIVRLANLMMAGEGARLDGGLNLALATLGLNGSFVMTPARYEDASGLVEPDTARIILRVTGNLAEPQVDIDLGEMVAAIQVRANELEVDRLEAMRLEDEARQRAAAEERNRLIEEQRRQAAEAAARRAEAEEAQRVEEERRRLEQQPQIAPQPAPPTDLNRPLDLGLQPGFQTGVPTQGGFQVLPSDLLNLPR
ncbi:AsmA-like C-terminal region-containing protein [Devosia sp. SD17-2]|uniref:AsmA family protein n=1 Tax=Devosia sp. SD17-2 TaxID=2976459 RepID=UPI0023D8C989|nr:AsmA-like C-terminal region-containing protein [Devosia sp. SD17-2]WEJ34725.1 AsmA family protein [Devosia sp. SD17-2]